MTCEHDAAAILMNSVRQAPEASLEDMLRARDERVERQRSFLAGNACSLVSVTLNIPGAHKAHPLVEKAFAIARAAVLG